MCLAIPGKVISVDTSGALRMGEVDFGGVKRSICLEWLPEAGVGDYVLAHVGTALSIVDPESAADSLSAFGEIEQMMEEEGLLPDFEPDH
ncbi:MAG: HypC/HybG/HupF family hydrogenase formation chaperone [Bacteroidales bacterium]